MSKVIKKIVITGGPCSGKTSALAPLQGVFTEQGYTVITVPETATELIMAGLLETAFKEPKVFQELQLRAQLAKELIFNKAAESATADKILIIYDRGKADGKGFCPDKDFAEILDKLNLTEADLINDYDGVFHLETVAKGAVNYYTLDNNKARKETPLEAIVADNKLEDMWKHHPYFKIIDNSTDFENKVQRLINEISILLNK